MQGHFVIADISGYTRFLTESELEHANGIIGELLNAIIAAIQAPLKISRVEGDAVFLYGTMPEGMSGQTVVESVELLYCAFAQSLETMQLNTTCQCNACTKISSLGLKIVMHCGEYAVANVGGTETLSGADVVVAHRLLKNSIRETTGIDDYMLITQRCVDDLGVESIVGGWISHSEEYEDVGLVHGYVSSLPDVWSFIRQQNENKVLQRDAWRTFGSYSSAAPAVVWDHLVDPIKRTLWLDANENSIIADSRGRIGPGSEYHCAHGDSNDIAIFTVLDMRTVDYVTFLMPVGGEVAMRYTDYVLPSGSGTRIVSHVAPLFNVETGEALPEETLAEMEEAVAGNYQASLTRLAEMASEAAPAGI